MLRENTANLTQRFTHHEYLGTQTIRDAYFDKNGVLMDQGIYLRKRDDEWEVKVRKAGGYINSSFEEFSDLGTIMKVVEGALGDDGKSGSGNGDGEQGASALIHRMCDCVADMRTTREMWEVDGFKVVIDKMCFGHMVGEVELVCEVADSRGDEKDGEKEMLEMMDGRIEKFMGEHGDVFPRGGKVEGKLSAWFRVEKERRGT
jgi:thiamine-triphosphatase